MIVIHLSNHTANYNQDIPKEVYRYEVKSYLMFLVIQAVQMNQADHFHLQNLVHLGPQAFLVSLMVLGIQRILVSLVGLVDLLVLGHLSAQVYLAARMDPVVLVGLMGQQGLLPQFHLNEENEGKTITVFYSFGPLAV